MVSRKRKERNISTVSYSFRDRHTRHVVRVVVVLCPPVTRITRPNMGERGGMVATKLRMQ